MCVEIDVDDGPYVESLGELHAFAGNRIVFDSEYPDDAKANAHCLCGVNLKKTAAKSGYSSVQDFERNPFGVVWEKSEEDGG